MKRDRKEGEKPRSWNRGDREGSKQEEEVVQEVGRNAMGRERERKEGKE